MKKFFLSLVLGATAGLPMQSAPAPIWRNIGVTNNPQVDAVIVENLGAIDASSPIPFDFRNTLYVTNTGTMTGSVGFRFDHVTYGGLRSPLDTFVNSSRGRISVSAGATPALLEINATNLISKGLLSASADGVIKLRGQNVDLSRGGFGVNPLQAGGFFLTPTNFYPDDGMTDNYWNLSNAIVQVSNFGLQTNADGTVNVVTPQHEVVRPCYVTNGNVLRLISASAYGRYQEVSPSNIIVQAAFVANSEPTINHEVRFAPSSILTNPYATIAVRLFGRETNVVEGGELEHSVYIVDLLASETNYVLLTNAASSCPTFMPWPLQISRTPRLAFFRGVPAPPLATNDIFARPDYLNAQATNIYAAYSVNIAHQAASFSSLFGLSNSPGRVDIEADTLNLERARFRGNNLVSIKTKHLVSSERAVVDSELINYDLGSTNQLLSVKSLVQPTVQRFFGQVNAYSEVWTNYFNVTETNQVEDPPGSGMMTNQVTTNLVEIGFHVLFVDGRLERDLDAYINDLTLRGANTVVSDDIQMLGTLFVESESLTLDGDLRLFGPFTGLPQSATENWDATVAPNLLYFTNRGDLFIPDSAKFGADRAAPYKRFVNEGSITVFAGQVETDEFDNSGNIRTDGSGFTLSARSAKLETTAQAGVIPNGIEVQGDLTLNAGDLKARNYRIVTRSALYLSVTNTLADSGVTASNVWEVNNGFHLVRKPGAGALLGTTLRTTAANFAAVEHTWAAEDRGASKAGFENNAALGRLVINSGFDGLLHFAGAGAKNAMYVDFLSLGANIAADPTAFIQVAPNLTIYFADASLPVEQLEALFPGRLRWVSEFAGPNSGVDVTLSDGRLIRVNRALRDSQTIDSDGDGIANFFDIDPFSGVRITGIRVRQAPGLVELTWEGLPGVVYGIEFTRELRPRPVWQLLQNFTNTATEIGPVTVQTPLPVAEPARFYRVTYTP
jgi:hypothetical protein